MKRLTVALFFALAASCAFAQQNQQTTLDDADRAVPQSKRTVLGLYLSTSEAYAKWKSDPGNVTIIDVRTPEEYVFVGHPEMAWNIPLKLVAYELDGKHRKLTMKPNAIFVSQVKKVVQTTDTVLVICRSGSRSAAAANLLAETGFKQVFNVIDGVEGDKVDDPESVFDGKRMKNGWKNAGLPWTYDVDPAKMPLSSKLQAANASGTICAERF